MRKYRERAGRQMEKQIERRNDVRKGKVGKERVRAQS